MASIASSRRGRPNTARDSDYIEIYSDLQLILDNFKRAEHIDREEIEYRLSITCVKGEGTGSNWGWQPYLTVNSFSICGPEKIRRGEVNVYKVELRAVTLDSETVIMLRHIIIPDDAEEPIDVCQCREATPEEIAAALDPREA